MSKNKVVIIDYGSGNLRSAAKAFEKIAHEESLNMDVLVSGDADDLAGATHIVLPGQGAFGDCIAGLRGVDGMIEALEDNVLKKGKPFLGICVGMQLLAERGFEGGLHTGLGWIEGEVVTLAPEDSTLKIPHMGWNTLMIPSATIQQDNAHNILQELNGSSHFYFVHSYMFRATNLHHIMAFTDYGGLVPAVVGRDNIIGTQFHPEKSHKDGLALIGAFARWRP